jgi:hypothetical protein
MAVSSALSGSPTSVGPLTNTAGNFLVIVSRQTITAISDTLSNTNWTNANITNGSIWYCPNCKGGANTLSCTTAGGCQSVWAEYSGIALTSPLDVQNASTATGTGTAAASNSITTTKDGDLIIGYGWNSTTNSPTITAGSGFTLRNNNPSPNSHLQDRLLTPAGAITSQCTYSASATWFESVISFKAAIPGGGGGALNKSLQEQRKFII